MIKIINDKGKCVFEKTGVEDIKQFVNLYFKTHHLRNCRVYLNNRLVFAIKNGDGYFISYEKSK